MYVSHPVVDLLRPNVSIHLRSSQNSTPGNTGSDKSVCSNGVHPGAGPILDSGSECEEAHIRTAEAFMSGIKSAISASMQVILRLHETNGNNPNPTSLNILMLECLAISNA